MYKYRDRLYISAVVISYLNINICKFLCAKHLKARKERRESQSENNEFALRLIFPLNSHFFCFFIPFVFLKGMEKLEGRLGTDSGL